MSGDTQEQILDAVQSVIVRDGVRGASMRQVAQEADVSLGLISYHFDDKDTLILAAFERATTTLLEASRAACAEVDDPAKRVAAFLRGSFTDEFLDGDYLRLRISLWAVSVTDPAVAAVDARFYEQYASELAELIATAQPDVSAKRSREISTDVIAYSNGLWLDWARFADVDALERGLQACEALATGR